MLEPITQKVTDDSTDRAFIFTFYCDLCGKPWQSIPVSVLPASECKGKKQTDAQRFDHDAAYERANLEAMQHFNRCPLCRLWVCNDCYQLLDEGDMCRKCAAERRG